MKNIYKSRKLSLAATLFAILNSGMVYSAEATKTEGVIEAARAAPAQTGYLYVFHFNAIDDKTNEALPVTLVRTRLRSAKVLEEQQIFNVDTSRYRAPQALQVVIEDLENHDPKLDLAQGDVLMKESLTREEIEARTQTLWLRVGEEDIAFDWAIDALNGYPIHPSKFSDKCRFFCASVSGGLPDDKRHYFSKIPPQTDTATSYVTIEKL